MQLEVFVIIVLTSQQAQWVSRVEFGGHHSPRLLALSWLQL
jgi:hypothetical protein